MRRLAVFSFGLAAYTVFLAAVVVGMLFVGDLLPPWGLDGPVTTAWPAALALDLALIALFGLQHSLMARERFKHWSTRLVPPPLERSLFVASASLCLLLLFWQWRPLPGALWDASGTGIGVALTGVSWLGWALVVAASFMIDHFDLFGMRQVTLYLRGVPYTPPPFKARTAYQIVRHPLMLGFMIAFWSAPRMSLGHALFGAGMTAYILIGVRYEERDLARVLGQGYADYVKRVPAFIPWPRRR